MSTEREPIWVSCEGSGYPPCAFPHVHEGMCAMCGRWKPLDGLVLSEHQRPDILAMIDRGDFR